MADGELPGKIPLPAPPGKAFAKPDIPPSKPEVTPDCDYGWLPDPQEFSNTFIFITNITNEIINEITGDIFNDYSTTINEMNEIYYDLSQQYHYEIDYVANITNNVTNNTVNNILTEIYTLQEETNIDYGDGNNITNNITINECPPGTETEGEIEIEPPEEEPPEPPEECSKPNELEWLEMTMCGQRLIEEILDPFGGPPGRVSPADYDISLVDA